MFCSKCGRQNIEGAVFCASCGTELIARQPAKKKTSLSLAAGILDILCGAGVLFFAIVIMVLFVATLGDEEAPPPPALVLLPLAMAIVGGLSLAGGICALRRKNWPIALTGAILSVLTTSILGVAALLLTVMARDEFDR